MGRTIVSQGGRAGDARRAVDGLVCAEPQGAGERNLDDPAADRAGTRTKDDADVGQPGTSPGTRGGATAFGGIKRETPRTKTPSPQGSDRNQVG
ncbi:hypothetical protein [Azospirillum sp. sgz301742]